MKNKKANVISVFMLIFALLILYGLYFSFFSNGFIKTTDDGEHTGTVTAVEKNGIIFKTYSVYFKSDAQSSQEDIYCVIDEELVKNLKDKAINKTKITIQYIDYFIIGYKYCAGEPAIIVGIK